MTAFLDTNCLVKIYHAEVGTQEITDFIMRHGSSLTVIIAEISIVEFRSAFMRRCRMGEISRDVADKTIAIFHNDTASMLVAPLSTTVVQESLRLLETHAGNLALKTLDSLQISSALVFSRITPIDMVLSSDKTFLEVMRKYLTALNPMSDSLP
ncbi:MAG: PIN domain-containing protein [Candidatus Kapaibacterium sp.]|nr:MAG: PIN domain-containing protein [Candidatus Kapabacteria bacterium]